MAAATALFLLLPLVRRVVLVVLIAIRSDVLFKQCVGWGGTEGARNTIASMSPAKRPQATYQPNKQNHSTRHTCTVSLSYTKYNSNNAS
jgi:hypothetical protein